MDRKIRALIVDDESLARKFIRRMLRADNDMEVVGECKNGAEALTCISDDKPDLVFLDVQMPEMDGFSLLESLGPERIPLIIFTTAYEQYAIRAFELHALDYLLKPFDQTRFQDALAHAKDRLKEKPQQEQNVLQIAALLDSIRKPSQHLDRVFIKSKGRISFLKTDEINWIEADDKYVHLHTKRGEPMIRQTLSAMEAQLNPTKFLRIHRSAIVNIERIKELHPTFSGEHEVLLDDGTTLTLSRHYKDKVFDSLGKPL